MTVSTSIQVVGVKDALRELNSIDKRIRRRVTVEFREIVDPLVQEAKTLVPRKAPMTGWERVYRPSSTSGRQSREAILPYNPNAALNSVKPFVSGKRPKTFGGYTRNLAAFGVRWTDKSAVLFDFAGQSSTPQGRQMIQVLNQRYGNPSRAMWLAYKQAGPDVQNELVELIEKVMAAVGRDIQVRR